MDKEYLLLLMNGYCDAVRRDCEVSEFMTNHGITVFEENNPLVCSVEKILNSIDKSGILLDTLLELSLEGSASFIINEEPMDAFTVEDIYYILLGDEE